MIDRSNALSLARRGAVSASFSALRGSLLAALGLSMAACGGNVSGGSSAGSAGAGGSGGASAGCEDAKAILQPDGKDSGYVMCSDGAIDRVAKVACSVTLKDTCQGTEMTMDCMTGADCKAKPNGSCLGYATPGPGGTMTGCSCSYQCATDADCGPGQACACAGVADPAITLCTSTGDCAGPADCPSGECGFAKFNNGCGEEHHLFCRAASDACRVDGDCAGNQCAKTDPASTWSCNGATCTIGRPLLVEQSPRFAPPSRRADWADAPLSPDTQGLSPDVRAALAAHYKAMAAMEHASIGSFARFALELLALGAPPELLVLTQQAMADEIAHARLSYSLASAYSGSATGPGPLCVTGVAPSSDPAEIVRGLVREACVGETIAAAEASALALTVEDAVVAQAYHRIAADEARHAELGYRALAWILRERPELGPVAQETFASAMSAVSAAPLVATGVTAPELGLLSPASLGALRAKARAEIVEPCRRAALSQLAA